MSDERAMRKSFSGWKRWGLGLDLAVRTALVLAVVVMANYLGARWYERFYLNPAMRQQLSPQTIGLLKSITNQVRITLFYNQSDPLFTTVSALLHEYRDANPRLRVTAVDYLRDAGAAEQIKAQYKNQFLTGTNKDQVFFECEGRVIPVPGQALGQYTYDQLPNPDRLEFRKRTVFHGERLFTAALLAVTSPKPLKACYLTGHEEHKLEGTDEVGYQTFAAVVAQYYIKLTTLSLLGTNTVPADCNLLIIAGPKVPLDESEREKVADYLHQGGRLLALVNSATLTRLTGVEKILAGWGVDVGDSKIVDPKHTTKGLDVVAVDFGTHAIVTPLHGSQLQFWVPRAMGRLDVGQPPAGAPSVQALAYSSEQATAGKLGPKRFPLAVAVEKGAVKEVITERGSTRIVAVGDSIFLGNYYIEAGANKDFLGFAVNWLLERTHLMKDLGPRPIAEYRLTLAASQLRSLQWMLLGAIPGGVLAFGGLVWLRRRK